MFGGIEYFIKVPLNIKYLIENECLILQNIWNYNRKRICDGNTTIISEANSEKAGSECFMNICGMI